MIFQEKDFTLTDCLDYVKTGVEAIIEDQVTSRFEAEELKNWNLLTRTNRHYEFISWKLTVIWMCGFVIRYFFLFPLRVLICFIGVSFRFFFCFYLKRSSVLIYVTNMFLWFAAAFFVYEYSNIPCFVL